MTINASVIDQIVKTHRKALEAGTVSPLGLIPKDWPEGKCGCGCKEQISKARGFKPGHDARLKGEVRRAAGLMKPKAAPKARKVSGRTADRTPAQVASIKKAAAQAKAETAARIKASGSTKVMHADAVKATKKAGKTNPRQTAPRSEDPGRSIAEAVTQVLSPKAPRATKQVTAK